MVALAAEHVGVRTTAHKAVASQVDQLERGDLRRYMVHLAGQEKEAPHRRDQDHDRDVKSAAWHAQGPAHEGGIVRSIYDHAALSKAAMASTADTSSRRNGT